MTFLINKKKVLPALGVVCLLPLSVQIAQASSTISSFANLTYTINNINISSGPGNVNGLDITDSFEILPRDPQYDAPDDLSLSDTSPYINKFSLSSTVGDGSAHYAENAVVGLNFLNMTDDTSYDVQVTLDYLLSADSAANLGTAGDQAETEVLLSWFNSDISFSGADYIASYANNAAQLGEVQTAGSSGLFSFTLAPGDVEVLFADVKITGNLVASPVPVPAAIWLFASALLAFPGLNRIKSGA